MWKRRRWPRFCRKAPMLMSRKKLPGISGNLCRFKDIGDQRFKPPHFAGSGRADVAAPRCLDIDHLDSSW